MSKPYKLMTEEEKSKFNQYCIQRWQQRKLDAIEYKGGSCVIDRNRKIYTNGSSFTESAVVGGIVLL